MKTTIQTAVLAATLISSATTTITAAHADEAKDKCHGVNNCKDQTACATSRRSCAGTNSSCKGKSWLPMDKATCKDLRADNLRT